MNEMYKDECKERAERKRAMIEDHAKWEAMKKLDQEKQKLSQMHLITSPKELQDELLSIDKKSVSTTKKRALK